MNSSTTLHWMWSKKAINKRTLFSFQKMSLAGYHKQKPVTSMTGKLSLLIAKFIKAPHTIICFIAQYRNKFKKIKTFWIIHKIYDKTKIMKVKALKINKNMSRKLLLMKIHRKKHVQAECNIPRVFWPHRSHSNSNASMYR